MTEASEQASKQSNAKESHRRLLPMTRDGDEEEEAQRVFCRTKVLSYIVIISKVGTTLVSRITFFSLDGRRIV